MGKKSKMGWEDGPQGGQFGGGGPEIPSGGFSQGPFHGPSAPVLPPEVRYTMTDVQQNGTSRGGVPLYQGTDQYGREWQWSERGPIGYLDDEDGIWHNVSNQDGVWSDEWTDKNGNDHHAQRDGRGNWVDTWTDQNGKVHEGFLADGEWHEWHPGVQLESAWIGSTDASGKVHHTATDDTGRKWDWFRDDQGEINLGYTDPEGNRHEVSEQDGIWNDRWTDQGGRDWHSTLGDQGETIWPDADLQEPPPEDFKDKTLAEPPPPYQGAPPEDFKDKALADDQAPTPGDFIKSYGPNAPYQERPPDDFKGKALSDDALHAQQQAAEGERGKALLDDAKQQAAEGEPPPEPPPPPKEPPVEPPK